MNLYARLSLYMDYFNPINAVIEGTGALFNSSKKRFVWRFELDSEEHSVELECSFLTNKRRVTFDGSLIFKGMKPLLSSDFQYQFKHKSHIITVFNHRNDANLLIDSLSFDLLYSKKILNQVKNFGNKEKPQVSSSPLNNPMKNEEKGPKAARFLTDEEYEKAVSVSKNFVAPKKSLREILEKHETEKGTTKNVDLLSMGNEKNKDLFDWQGSISDRGGKTAALEDFLSIGAEEKHEDLLGFNVNNRNNEELFVASQEKYQNVCRNANLDEDFLGLGAGAKEKTDTWDLGSGNKANLKVVNDDFLSLGQDASKADLIFENPQKKNLPSSDFLDLDSANIADNFVMENFDFKSGQFELELNEPKNHLQQDLIFDQEPMHKTVVNEIKSSQVSGLDIFSPVPVINESASPFTIPSQYFLYRLSVSYKKSNKDFDSLFS